MDEINWKAEPDLVLLRDLYALLAEKPSEAVPGLVALAERGSVASMLYLADFYITDKPFARADLSKAQHWYEMAYKGGSPQAAYMFGRLLYKSKEYDGAFSAFLDGAQWGYLPAIYRLAKMYQMGEGCEKNIKECRNCSKLLDLKGTFLQSVILRLFSLRANLGLLRPFVGQSCC